MKRLIDNLRKINPKVDMNIYKSTFNVNLNTIISYKKDDKECLEIKEVQMQMEQLYKLDPLAPIYIINDSSFNLRDLSLLPISTLVYQFDKTTYESKKRELENIRCNRLILQEKV